MAQRAKVTPETFDAFLAMKNAGVKLSTVAEILGISAGTVYCMSSAGTYEKYRAWANRHIEQMQQRKAAKAKAEAEAKAEAKAKEERERALQIAEKQREAIREAEAKRSMRKKWDIFGKKRQTNTMKITFEIEVTDDTYELIKPATSVLTALFNRDGESKVTVKTNE